MPTRPTSSAPTGPTHRPAALSVSYRCSPLAPRAVGASVTTGEQITARDFLGGLPVLGESEVYDEICDRLDAGNDGERASAIELALEGLYLAQKVSKESGGGEAIYG